MDDLIKTGGNDLLAVLHAKTGAVGQPVPFERDIFLFETYVAGTTHIEGMEELEPFLKIGDKLNFYREPDNAFDPKAILIETENGVKIGYVPKADNVIFSRLMDAGKLLFGVITSKETRGGWVKINISINLHE